MRKESKKCIRSIFLAVLTAMLFVSCGGGGGGGMVSFQNNSGFHNGGDAGGWGNGHQTSNNGLNGGSINGSLSTKAGTFTPPNDINWERIDLTITITSGGTTTTHTLANTETEAIAELLTSLKRGDVVEVTADITMVDDDPRTTSSGAVTIGVGDNHISLPTPYKFECSMEMTRNMYEDYGCSDTPADASVSGSQTGIYTVNNASSVIPPDASGTGFIFDHWETVPDGQVYVPGSSRGDVVISPVFKPDYSVAYTDLVDTIVITEQSEFNTLMSTHAAQNFSGKEIKLYCNVSTSTGFTNTTDGFQGTFNGNNKTVNVNLTNNDENGLGFCYKLASGATIQNLTITGSLVYSGSDSISTDSVANAGAFAAYNQGSIEHCKNMANVTTTNSDCNHVGGIVGFGDGAGSLTGCSNYGTIDNAGNYAGGIIGCISGNFSIYQCFNKGSVTAHKSSGLEQHVGGIVGTDSSAGRIEHCYNTGNVIITANSNSDAGGIVGLTNDGTISSCFNYGTANIQTSFGGGSCKQIASAVYGTTITDVYCTVPTNAGSSLTSGTMTDAINMLPVTEPLIWELRSGASYPTLINNPE